MDYYLEVRCCCQPRKLLGWLPVPRGVVVAPGVTVAFVVERARLVRARVPRGRYGFPLEGTERLDDYTHIDARKVTLPIARWNHGRLTGLAYKSDDTPIEDLRQIEGFVENPAPLLHPAAEPTPILEN
jgi:hypothetical protein